MTKEFSVDVHYRAGGYRWNRHISDGGGYRRRSWLDTVNSDTRFVPRFSIRVSACVLLALDCRAADRMSGGAVYGIANRYFI